LVPAAVKPEATSQWGISAKAAPPVDEKGIGRISHDVYEHPFQAQEQQHEELFHRRRGAFRVRASDSHLGSGSTEPTPSDNLPDQRYEGEELPVWPFHVWQSSDLPTKQSGVRASVADILSS
jgi:hypothetical protein